ncbi:MAG TPA: hypothetical protein VLF39_03380 [Candidatus Saccharimonadales bacterium]|nr:hypothetical protein [Candidatus Saccharimonadales bacterium]
MPETLDRTAIESQPENLEPPELLIDHKILYRGSATSGLNEFSHAQETTVGEGVYFVDNSSQAAEYAKRRGQSLHGSHPVVAKAEVNNLKLVNLSNPEKLQAVMEDFGTVLQKKKESLPEDTPFFRAASIDKSLESIGKGIQVGRVKEAIFSHSASFTNYLRGLGYDGLKTPEGGEGDDIGKHDTFLIFDPEKIKLISETPVA